MEEVFHVVSEAPKRPHHTFCIIAVLLVMLICASICACFQWERGSVISTAKIGADNFPFTFCIRQIPTEPPFQNDGPAYRCEIWRRGILWDASTFQSDSFTADKTSITVIGGGHAVFHIGGYDVSFFQGTWKVN
jgi:hypothetical protein